MAEMALSEDNNLPVTPEDDISVNRENEVNCEYNTDDYAENSWSLPLDDECQIRFSCHTTMSVTSLLEGSKYDHSRTIVHVDMDCFYAQVEMIEHPPYRTEPLGVQQKGFVVTTNYVARAFGVPKCCSVNQARDICPSIILVNGEDLTRYRNMSYKITEFLSTYSNKVERLGFDENFIDITSMVSKRLDSGVSLGEIFKNENSHDFTHNLAQSCSCGCVKRLKVGTYIAAEMRRQLYEKIGVTCCAGIAWNKLLAKLIGSQHKPNQQTTLYPDATHDLLSGLSDIRKLPGIGHSSFEKLKAISITSVKDLQCSDMKRVVDVFGQPKASFIRGLSLGNDESLVINSGKPQSVSEEDMYKDCNTIDKVKWYLCKLIQELQPRIMHDGRLPRTVRLTVRKIVQGQWLGRQSRQCQLPSNVSTVLVAPGISAEYMDGLLEISLSLFRKLVDTSKSFQICLMNLCFTKFKDNEAASTVPINAFFAKTVPIGDSEISNNFTQSNPPGGSTSCCIATSKIGFEGSDTGNLDGVMRQNRVSDPPRVQHNAFVTLGGTEDCENRHMPTNSCVDGETCGDDQKIAVKSIDALPPNVDKDVFAELPLDIQQGIITEWKEIERKKIRKINFSKKTCNATILKYFRRK